jgi:hypothetical protein
MGEKYFPSESAGVPAKGLVTATAGQSAAWDPQAVTSELRSMTLAAETTLAMARNLEDLGQSLETLGRILQTLERRL